MPFMAFKSYTLASVAKMALGIKMIELAKLQSEKALVKC